MDFAAVILFFWARWLSKQPGTPTWLRYVGPALVVAFFGSLFGTVGGLLWAFKAVGSVDAAHRSQFLAEGISRAMNFTAAAIAFDAVVLVALAIITWTRPKA